MKTKKYLIEFENIECVMSSRLEISHKEFVKMFTTLCNEVESTKDYESPLTYIKTISDSVDCICITHAFRCAAATTYMYELICKSGYCFSN